MKKLLLVTAALLAMTAASNADIVTALGDNPTSGTGAFANTNPGTGGGGSGLFTDIYTFQLVGGPQFLTIASVTNVFASDSQFITNFTGSVLNDGPDGVPGGGDDTPVIGPVLASACPLTPNCQGFSGSATLDPGNYYLQLTGNAAVDAGYGGNLSTAPVPGPIVGAGLPGLMAACGGLLALARRRRQLV
jgi:hypothetical protein